MVPTLTILILSAPQEVIDQIYDEVVKSNRPILLTPLGFNWNMVRPYIDTSLGVQLGNPRISARNDGRIRDGMVARFMEANKFLVCVGWAREESYQNNEVMDCLRVLGRDCLELLKHLTIVMTELHYVRCQKLVGLAHTWSKAHRMGVPKAALAVKVIVRDDDPTGPCMARFTEEWMLSLLNMAFDEGALQAQTREDMSIKIQDWHNNGEGGKIATKFLDGPAQAAKYLGGRWP